MKSFKSILLTAGTFAVTSSVIASIEIDTVLVGNAGNANDTTGYGGVSYDYHIGTYEVTNSQYTAFLNATAATDTHSLYNSNMNSSSYGGIQQSGTSGSFTYSVKTDMGNKSVNFVSFWDAARFTNWLTNGQGSGDTETGVYNLNGTTAPTNDTITRNATAWNDGGVAIASEHEWYKAAYYDPTLNSGDGGYWDYAHQSDSITTADANYASSGGTVTDVGTCSDDASYYGTFDQGGNVWEWNDTIIGSSRGARGGAFGGSGPSNLQSSFRPNVSLPTYEHSSIGFRVSSLAPIPEPSACAAILGCLGLGLALTRRKGRSARL